MSKKTMSLKKRKKKAQTKVFIRSKNTLSKTKQKNGIKLSLIYSVRNLYVKQLSKLNEFDRNNCIVFL